MIDTYFYNEVENKLVKYVVIYIWAATWMIIAGLRWGMIK